MIHAIKAFAKSQKIPPICVFLLMDLNTLSVSVKAAASVGVPFIKSYLSVISKVFACRCWLIYLA